MDLDISLTQSETSHQNKDWDAVKEMIDQEVIESGNENTLTDTLASGIEVLNMLWVSKDKQASKHAMNRIEGTNLISSR